MQIAFPKPSLWSLASGLEALETGIRLALPDDDFADGLTGWQWTLYKFSGVETVDESSGVLNIDILSGSGYRAGGYKATSNIVGDFDIQVDFSNFIGAGSGYGTANLFFQVDVNNYVYVRREYDDVGANRFQSAIRIGGVTVDLQNHASTVTSGRLRVVRYGEVIITYYDAGSGWVAFGSALGFPTSDIVTHYVQATATVSATVTVDFDNYQVNRGGWFIATAPAAESPWVACRGTLDAATPVIIEENRIAALLGYSTGNVRYQYALNNGTYNGTWLTQAQLQSALAGQQITDTANSLRLKVQFSSDGTQAADISGFGSCVQSSVPQAFHYPLSTEVEGNEYEATVIEEYEAEVAIS